MTYILNKQQKILIEKGNPDDYEDSYTGCVMYAASLKSYPILPEQWEGYEDGAEVEEGEFTFDMEWDEVGIECRWTGRMRPKQKQASQSELWEEALLEYSKEFYLDVLDVRVLIPFKNYLLSNYTITKNK